MREWLGGDCLRMTTRRHLYSLRNIYALQRSGPGSCGGKSSVRAVFVFCVFPLDLDHNCCYSPIARLFFLFVDTTGFDSATLLAFDFLFSLH
ncbi:hypothetical protein QL093DRAFT_2134761 [Fusarium oxysporum]|nr:hypothetical protein QL093DRAFT_2134761 [Fusarium oxysporum]